MLKAPNTLFKDEKNKKETLLSLFIIYGFLSDSNIITKNSFYYDYNFFKLLHLFDISQSDIPKILNEIFLYPFKTKLYTIKKNKIILSNEISLKIISSIFKKLYNDYGDNFIKFINKIKYYTHKYDLEVLLALTIKDEKFIKTILSSYDSINYFVEKNKELIMNSEDLSFIKDSQLKKIFNDIINKSLKYELDTNNFNSLENIAKTTLNFIKHGYTIKEKYLNFICLYLLLFLKKDILKEYADILPENLNTKYIAKGLAFFLDNDDKKCAENFSKFVSNLKSSYFKNNFPWFSVLTVLIALILYKNNYIEKFNYIRDQLYILSENSSSALLLREFLFEKEIKTISPINKKRFKLNELSIIFYMVNCTDNQFLLNFFLKINFKKIPYLEKEILSIKKKELENFNSILHKLKETNFYEQDNNNSPLIISALKKNSENQAELIFGIKDGNLFPFKKEKLKNGKFKITQLRFDYVKDCKYKWIKGKDKIFCNLIDYWDFNYSMLDLLIDSDKIYLIKDNNEFSKIKLKKTKPNAICKLEDKRLIFLNKIVENKLLEFINDTFLMIINNSELLNSIKVYLKEYQKNYYTIKTNSYEELFEIMKYLADEINFKLIINSNNNFEEIINKLKFNKIIDYENGIFAYAGTTNSYYSIDFFCLPFENFDYYADIYTDYYYIKKDDELILINFFNDDYKNLLLNLMKKIPKIKNSSKLIFKSFEDFLKTLTYLNSLNDITVKVSEELMIKHCYKVSQSNIKLNITESGNYFDIDAQIDLPDKKFIKFKKILEKIYDNIGNFVKISNGEYIELNENLIERLKKLALISFPSEGKLKVNKKIFNLLNSEKFKKRVNEIFEETYDVPENFNGELRDYQIEGYNWLVKMYKVGLGACLGDDMGLGKTVQSIAFMEKVINNKPFIVIVPASLIFNWEREIKKFSNDLNPIIYFQNRNIDFKKLKGTDVLIISYGLVVNDIEKIKKHEFNVAIYDEAQLIKNYNTNRSEACKSINAKFKMITTGTPVENNLMELWNLMDLINPGILGPVEHFRKKFANCDNEKLLQFKNVIKTFILRRNKKDELNELPEKTEIIVDYNLTDEENAFYNALKTAALEKLQKFSENEISKNTLTILSEIVKLKQACCYAKLIDNSIDIKESSKITILFQLIEELIESGHKALIFSQFVQFLKIVENELKRRKIKYLLLTGSIPVTKRKKLIDKFQKNDDIKLFLLSLKTGGVGLNLTSADIVIHLDPWWNPAVEEQASDRIYRIGQKKPVTIYKLIAKGTIEEKILNLQNKKRELANFILSETDKVEKINLKDILELLH